MKLYDEFLKLQEPLNPQEKKGQLCVHKNINKKPFLDVPHKKSLYGGMHTVMGNIQHFDDKLCSELNYIDSGSSFESEA